MLLLCRIIPVLRGPEPIMLLPCRTIPTLGRPANYAAVVQDNSHLGEPLANNEKSVQLTCKHLFHDQCIRGWTLVGKKDTCPVCLEKVDLRTLYADRPWDTRNLTWYASSFTTVQVLSTSVQVQRATEVCCLWRMTALTHTMILILRVVLLQDV